MFTLAPNYDIRRHQQKFEEIELFFENNPGVTQIDEDDLINEAYQYVTDPFLDWVSKGAYRYATTLGYEDMPLQCVLNGLYTVLKYGHAFDGEGSTISNKDGQQGYVILPRTVRQPVQLYFVQVVGDPIYTTFEINKLTGSLAMMQGEKRAVDWQLFYDHREQGLVPSLRWRRIYQNLVMRERSGLAMDQYPVYVASTHRILADLRRRLPHHVSSQLPRDNRSVITSTARIPMHHVLSLSSTHLQLVADGMACPNQPNAVTELVNRVNRYLSEVDAIVKQLTQAEKQRKT